MHYRRYQLPSGAERKKLKKVRSNYFDPKHFGPTKLRLRCKMSDLEEGEIVEEDWEACSHKNHVNPKPDLTKKTKSQAMELSSSLHSISSRSQPKCTPSSSIGFSTRRTGKDFKRKQNRLKQIQDITKKYTLSTPKHKSTLRRTELRKRRHSKGAVRSVKYIPSPKRCWSEERYGSQKELNMSPLPWGDLSSMKSSNPSWDTGKYCFHGSRSVVHDEDEEGTENISITANLDDSNPKFCCDKISKRSKWQVTCDQRPSSSQKNVKTNEICKKSASEKFFKRPTSTDECPDHNQSSNAFSKRKSNWNRTTTKNRMPTNIKTREKKNILFNDKIQGQQLTFTENGASYKPLRIHRSVKYGTKQLRQGDNAVHRKILAGSGCKVPDSCDFKTNYEDTNGLTANDLEKFNYPFNEDDLIVIDSDSESSDLSEREDVLVTPTKKNDMIDGASFISPGSIKASASQESMSMSTISASTLISDCNDDMENTLFKNLDDESDVDVEELELRKIALEGLIAKCEAEQQIIFESDSPSGGSEAELEEQLLREHLLRDLEKKSEAKSKQINDSSESLPLPFDSSRNFCDERECDLVKPHSLLNNPDDAITSDAKEHLVDFCPLAQQQPRVDEKFLKLVEQSDLDSMELGNAMSNCSSSKDSKIPNVSLMDTSKRRIRHSARWDPSGNKSGKIAQYRKYSKPYERTWSLSRKNNTTKNPIVITLGQDSDETDEEEPANSLENSRKVFTGNCDNDAFESSVSSYLKSMRDRVKKDMFIDQAKKTEDLSDSRSRINSSPRKVSMKNSTLSEHPKVSARSSGLNNISNLPSTPLLKMKPEDRVQRESTDRSDIGDLPDMRVELNPHAGMTEKSKSRELSKDAQQKEQGTLKRQLIQEIKVRQKILKEATEKIKEQMKQSEKRLKLKSAEKKLNDQRRETILMLRNLLEQMKKASQNLKEQMEMEIKAAGLRDQLNAVEKSLQQSKESCLEFSKSIKIKTTEAFQMHQDCVRSARNCREVGTSVLGANYFVPSHYEPQLKSNIIEIRRQTKLHRLQMWNARIIRARYRLYTAVDEPIGEIAAPGQEFKIKPCGLATKYLKAARVSVDERQKETQLESLKSQEDKEVLSKFYAAVDSLVNEITFDSLFEHYLIEETMNVELPMEFVPYLSPLAAFGPILE